MCATVATGYLHSTIWTRSTSKLAFKASHPSRKTLYIVHTDSVSGHLFRPDIQWISSKRSFSTAASLTSFGLGTTPTTLTSTQLFQARGRSNRSSRSYSESTPINMPRGVKKEHLPSKICVTCGRPFTWRKKWEKVWDEVTTCSKSCNSKRRTSKRQEGRNNDENGNDLATKMEDDSVCSSDGSKDLRLHRRHHPSEKTHQNVVDKKIVKELASMDLGDDQLNDKDMTDSFIVSIPASSAIDDDDDMDPEARRKAERKATKKANKAERRAQREGRGDPSAGQKKCDMCLNSVDLLIRCMYEEGQTEWKMVCGRCWKVASGGVVDGDANHPHYRYGGLWKNRRALK